MRDDALSGSRRFHSLFLSCLASSCFAALEKLPMLPANGACDLVTGHVPLVTSEMLNAWDVAMLYVL